MLDRKVDSELHVADDLVDGTTVELLGDLIDDVARCECEERRDEEAGPQGQQAVADGVGRIAGDQHARVVEPGIVRLDRLVGTHHGCLPGVTD